jgi:hypothetical protein
LARRTPAGPANHAIAGREVGDAGADAFDDAGKFRGRRERKRRLVLVFAGDDQQVEKIERSGFDADHRLARAGSRRLDVGIVEFLRRAEMGAQNGFHGNPSLGG